MPYTDKTLTCPDCAAQLRLANEDQQHQAGPCFQKGPLRCPSCGRTHDPERCSMAGGIMTWVISEDNSGFIQPDNTNDIARVFTQDGTLLAESAPITAAAQARSGGDLRGGRVERLLRYYFGYGGRRVVLLDGHGSRWLGRITGTRWHPNKGRVWFVLHCAETAGA